MSTVSAEVACPYLLKVIFGILSIFTPEEEVLGPYVPISIPDSL
jgi:hypothetical protein